jgi:hypothetical protein
VVYLPAKRELTNSLLVLPSHLPSSDDLVVLAGHSINIPARTGIRAKKLPATGREGIERGLTSNRLILRNKKREFHCTGN